MIGSEQGIGGCGEREQGIKTTGTTSGGGFCLGGGGPYLERAIIEEIGGKGNPECGTPSI